MAIYQPLVVLDQNPLGWKDYMGKGSKPCTNCTDISELKLLHLVISKKNGHLNIIPTLIRLSIDPIEESALKNSSEIYFLAK